MARSRIIKAVFVILAATTAMGVIIVAGLQDSAEETTDVSLPSHTLGLTGEARQLLQATDNAFPDGAAGFSAYYRVSDDIDGYALEKETVDTALFEDDPPQGSLMTETGKLDKLGGNYTIGSLSIANIDGNLSVSDGNLISKVKIYYDTEGWIVAYLPRGTESSRVWQAEDLDSENPSWLAVTIDTTLLNAVNEALDGAYEDAVTAEDLSYYHWEFPDATNFLMFGVAEGKTDTPKIVSFDIPSSFTIQEASLAQWTTKTSQGGLCNAKTLLDDSPVLTSCNVQEFLHSSVTLSSSTHTMKLSIDGDSSFGAAGSLAMIIYTVP